MLLTSDRSGMEKNCLEDCFILGPEKAAPRGPSDVGIFQKLIWKGLRDQQPQAINFTDGETEAQRGGKTMFIQQGSGRSSSSTQRSLLRHRPYPGCHSSLKRASESSLPGKQCHISVHKHSFDLRRTLVQILVLPVTCHDLE